MLLSDSKISSSVLYQITSVIRLSVRAVKINTDSGLISLFTENDMMSLLKSQQ